MNINMLLFSSTLLLVGISIGSCYLPVICIPGLMDIAHNVWRVCNEIERLHPGTAVFFIPPDTPVFNVFGMWDQVNIYKRMLEPIFAIYFGGVHVLAYSQGALLARAIIETTENHPVKNFLSVAGPFMGLYGIPFFDVDILGLNINNLVRGDAYQFAYTNLSQKLFSLAGYWNDPTKQELFLERSEFLPYINNLVDHPDSDYYKSNFLRLDNLILIGGDGDEVVIPWQSALGGFYDVNLNIVPMKEQHIYVNDTFGLRSLDERGGLAVVSIPGINHFDFVSDMSYTHDYYIHYLY